MYRGGENPLPNRPYRKLPGDGGASAGLEGSENVEVEDREDIPDLG